MPRSKLEKAIKKNNFRTVNKLLAHIDQAVDKEYCRTPLIIACSYGNIQMVKHFLSKKCQTNKTDNQNNTALAYAMYRYQLIKDPRLKESFHNIIILLINNKSDVLHMSVEKVFFLLASNDNLTISLNKMTDTHFYLCLLFARRWLKTGRLDQLEKAEIYFFKAKKIMSENSFFVPEIIKEFLMIATRPLDEMTLPQLVEQLKSLAKRGSRDAVFYLTFLQQTGVLNLHAAIEQENEKELEKLLVQGVLPNWSTISVTSSPLHIAVGKNSTAIVKLLCLNGADINALDCKNHTPISLAATLGHWECVDIIAERPTTEADDANYTFALKKALHSTQPLNRIKKLLDAKISPLPPDDGRDWSTQEYTFLHIAAEQNNLAAIRLLLLYKADVDIKDEKGYTSQDVANVLGHVAAAGLLNHKLPPVCKELNYLDFLHEECKAFNTTIMEGKIEEVRKYLNASILQQAVDEVFQFSWLHIAVLHMQPQIVQLLIEQQIALDFPDAVSHQTPLALAMNLYTDLQKDAHLTIILQLIPNVDLNHFSVQIALHKIIKHKNVLEKFLQIAEINPVMQWLLIREHCFFPFQLAINYEITYDEITFGKEIGQGVYGTVFAGTWNKQDVAIKLFIDGHHFSSKKSFEHERALLALVNQLQLPLIVKYYGFFESQNKYGVVLGYLPYTLNRYLHDHPALSRSTRYQIMQDITYSVKCLHSVGILHRDLKRSNVLLDEKLVPALCDFGFATLSNCLGESPDIREGTYEAPEVLAGTHFQTEKSDMFALGCTLWGIFSNRNFAQSAGNIKKIRELISKGIREPIPHGCPAKLATLITRCWEHDPMHRPTAAEAWEELNEIRKNCP